MIVLFVILGLLFALIAQAIYEDYKEREKFRKKCKDYLTGRVRRVKTPKGIIVEVQHYKGKRKFYKKPTSLELKWIQAFDPIKNKKK